MTKSRLIQRIAQTQSHLVERDVALAVNMMLEHMAACLAGGGRIEIRSFGSFSVRFRGARVGHNPRTSACASFPVIESLSSLIAIHLHRPPLIPGVAAVSTMLAERVTVCLRAASGAKTMSESASSASTTARRSPRRERSMRFCRAWAS